MKILLLPIVTIVSLCGLLKAAPFAMPDKMEDLMANYCFDCHDDETKKGEVRLDNLATLALKVGFVESRAGANLHQGDVTSQR